MQENDGKQLQENAGKQMQENDGKQFQGKWRDTVSGKMTGNRCRKMPRNSQMQKFWGGALTRNGTDLREIIKNRTRERSEWGLLKPDGYDTGSVGIRDILVRMRIRIPGSVPLTNGSGSDSFLHRL
jgi:hypothetical protein